MPKKLSTSKVKKEKQKARSNRSVESRDIYNSTVIAGDNNVINVWPEQAIFRSLHQLPPPPGDFTGRKTIIADLLKDFEVHKGTTTSGLTGMGGIGKTALGLEVAHRIADNYPDAQIFLDLKGTTTPPSSIDIMRHVILSFEPTANLHTLDDANISAAYQSVLHGKKSLLFFDNARSAEQIAPLRPPKTCAMFVTSRWSFPVTGLKTHKVGVLQDNEAIDFLLDLCPRIDDKAADLAKACAYLPLALRIAGSFLQVNGDWSIEKYLTLLKNRKKRLATLKQSHDDAELTAEPDLLATFELSYNQLSNEHQRHWRMLGVFPVSFDAVAAQATLELKKGETSKSLSILQRYGLLEYDDSMGRYIMHDLLIDFASQKINKKEKALANYNHSRHYLQVLHFVNELYSSGGGKAIDGLRLFDAEWNNILKGQTWAKRNYKKTDVAKICNYYSGALSCIKLRLSLYKQEEWIKSSLIAARFLKERRSEAVHLSNLAVIFYDSANTKKAIRYSKQSIRIAKEIGDHESAGVSLTNLGNIYALLLGKPQEALKYYWERLDLAIKQDDTHNICITLSNIAATFMEMGDLDGAIATYNNLISIFHKIGNYQEEAYSYAHLGRCNFLLGRPKAAIKHFDKALKLFSKIDDREGRAQTLINRGINNALLKSYGNALLDGKEALSVSQQLNRPREQILALQLLGMTYSYLGDIKKSKGCFLEAKKISKKIGIKHLHDTNDMLIEVFG